MPASALNVATNPAGASALTVNTVGGTATLLSSASFAYKYVDSIQVSPTTGVSGTSVPLSVQGYGFNNVTWTASTGGATTDDANAHVYLLGATGYGTLDLLPTAIELAGAEIAF